MALTAEGRRTKSWDRPEAGGVPERVPGAFGKSNYESFRLGGRISRTKREANGDNAVGPVLWGFVKFNSRV